MAKQEKITDMNIFKKAQINGNGKAYIPDGKNRVGIVKFLEKNKEEFAGIHFEGDHAYIARAILPVDLLEKNFSDTREDGSYVNITEAIKMYQEHTVPQGLSFEGVGVGSIERDVNNSNYIIIGDRFTRNDAINLIAEGDEKQYWRLVDSVGELYTSHEEADIIAHLCKVVPKRAKQEKTKTKEDERKGSGLEYEIAVIAEKRDDTMKDFRESIASYYGSFRNLNEDETSALAMDPEQKELRRELFESLPTPAKRETKKVYGDIFTAQARSQVRYGSEKVADSIDAKARENAHLSEGLANQEIKTEEDRAAVKKDLARLMTETKSLEAQKNQVEKGKMYVSIDGVVSSAIVAQKEGVPIDEIITKPEDDNIEEIVTSDPITEARNMIGKGTTTALAKLGEGYVGVIEKDGKKMPVKHTPRDSKLGDSAKKVVDLLFESVANLRGYTLRKKQGFQKPTHDEEVVIGAISMQVLADAGEKYNINNLKEIVGYINTEIQEVLSKESNTGEDIGDKLEKITILDDEARIRESNSRGEISNDMSVEEIEAQEAAYEAEIRDTEDLKRFGGVAEIIKESTDKAMDKLREIREKKKS